ncbi:MAG: MBL fold metallo-hydrolase [Pseudomonadota bacterium]|nr:MBL fold metallo-hydrolase [Pseudomonadota bacterium]
MAIDVKAFREAPLDNNNYVVLDKESHEAILIDCSADDPAVENYIREQGATLKYILITHGHFDHILGVNAVMKKYQVPAFISPLDLYLVADMNEWLMRMGFQTGIVPSLDVLPDRLMLGHIPIQVISTAGHTPGGVCYLIEDHLFSGDTLFCGTHGRVDLPLSDPRAMQDSLKNLMQLPDHVAVYPGHGRPTTIGAEKKNYTEL